jgi:hypothetical protein
MSRFACTSSGLARFSRKARQCTCSADIYIATNVPVKSRGFFELNNLILWWKMKKSVPGEGQAVSGIRHISHNRHI